MRHSAQSIAARRQETLGEFDLVNQITLHGPAYSDHGIATATFIHERAHQIIGAVTNYGVFQKSLALLAQAAAEGGATALEESANKNLNWVLNNAFDADEGYAMLRERDLSQMLGIPFDEASMTDEYAAALMSYDLMFSGYEFQSPGMKLLITQGIAEAVFNTDVLKRVSPADLFKKEFECESVISGTQRPDERLSVMAQACTDTDLLSRSELKLDKMITGRIAVGESSTTIDDAIIAAYEIPGVRSDQQLKLAYLAGSMAVSDSLVELGLSLFGTFEETIDPNFSWLNEVGRLAREVGLDFPVLRGSQDPNELRGAESVRYAPESEHFEVAWALPEFVAKLANEKNAFFFNSPSIMPAVPIGMPKVDEMSLFTVFVAQHNSDGLDVACSNVQLVVPWTQTDSTAAQLVATRIIDQVVVVGNEGARELQFDEADPGWEDDTIAILPNTDLKSLETLLQHWVSTQQLNSVRRVTSIGPLTYFELRFQSKPRVFIRVPLSVEYALRSGPDKVNRLLPATEAVWNPAIHGNLAKVFCHLCEAGAFFGAKRIWHDDFIDDLVRKGKSFGFRFLGKL